MSGSRVCLECHAATKNQDTNDKLSLALILSFMGKHNYEFKDAAALERDIFEKKSENGTEINLLKTETLCTLCYSNHLVTLG